jgi:hypothetical protein
MMTDAPATVVAKYVERRRTANAPFEKVHSSDNESHGSGIRGRSLANLLDNELLTGVLADGDPDRR